MMPRPILVQLATSDAFDDRAVGRDLCNDASDLGFRRAEGTCPVSRLAGVLELTIVYQNVGSVDPTLVN